ncbi:hypothetical protein G7054_g6538 [Neopestalotiopsis clavispora]|nr:hypothetical protein G7054_g6538 [Neopestalotiopsis clavispora]
MSTDSLDQILAALNASQREDYLNGPALSPPPGLESNLNDPANQNAMIRGVFAFYLLITTLVVASRMYCKLLIVREVQLQDYFGLIGYILFVSFCSVGLHLTTTTGMYVHQWDLRVRDLAVVYYAVNVASSIYAAAMGCLKVAIITDWIRTFSPHRRRGAFFWACQVLMWINIVFYSIALIVGNLTCRPYARIWDKSIPGTCMDRRDLDVSNAIFNIVTHLSVLILPHFVIWKLNMKTKTKLGISLVFAIGVFVCVAASLRLVATIKYSRTTDTTYWVCDMAFWCATELTCVVLVFCVPAVPRVIRELRVYGRLLDFLRLLSVQRSSYDNTPKLSTSETQLQRYGRMNENGVIMNGSNHVEAAATEPNEYPLRQAALPDRIIYTTRFETTGEYLDTQQEQEASKAQYYNSRWNH